MKEDARILIVGGGVMGCSLAYHLSRLGARHVKVLERKGVCSGETAKSGGFVQTHWSSSDEVKLINWSRTFFQEHEACHYQQRGYLHVTGQERLGAVQEVHDMLLGLGFESNWLGPRELKKLQPLLRVDDLVGGAYESCSGWADPIASTHYFAALARSHGAEIVENAQVLQIAHRQRRITGVETEDGFLEADVVVLAAGPWTPNLHPDAAQPLPIQAKRGQVCYMDRPGGLPRKELAFYDEITGLYTHPCGDLQLVGLDWHFDVVWGPDDYERQPDQDYLEAAHQALSHRFPSLAGARPIKAAVGLYDFTPDGHPIVDGPLGIDGYYVMAGFSGAGFKSSPALGLAMAEKMLYGEERTLSLHFLRRSRF